MECKQGEKNVSQPQKQNTLKTVSSDEEVRSFLDKMSYGYVHPG